MNDTVYKMIEVVGTSSVSSDDAIRNAVDKAAQSLDHISWYEVIQQRGHINDGEISHFQVTLKLGFRLD